MNVYSEKGSYRSDEPVFLILQTDDTVGAVELGVWLLTACVFKTRIVRTAAQMRLKLGPFAERFAGYGIVCEADNGETACCAVDVQQERRVFRYGFLSDFDEKDADDADIQALARHHVNAVQFYDWSYRHDCLVAPTQEYLDMMGKRNSLRTIRHKIGACHSHGMLALGYGAVYASSVPFARAHPDWRLYAQKDRPLRFIDVFAIMNLQSRWREHILTEYEKALSLGFDGVHMDTYGFPKTACDVGGNVVHLEDGFAMLLAEARARLGNAALVFNHVGGWPLQQLLHAPYDAAYIEVWPPFERYCHLKYLILTAKKSAKPVVLAAYPAAFRTDTPERALHAQLLLMSFIAAHGATQLWFGEENAAITQGYYADYTRLSCAQERALRSYDDFFVRYETVLFDETLVDVSMTHFGWDNEEYRCGVSASPDGSEGKLLLVLRESRRRKVVVLLNLSGGTDRWAQGRDAPEPVFDVPLQIQVFGGVRGVYLAEPEKDHGCAAECAYTLRAEARGDVLRVTVPQVRRCSLLWIDLDEQAL